VAYPSTPGHQSDPYTPEHVRQAVLHARTLLPRDRVACEVLPLLAAKADRNGVAYPAPGVRYLAHWAVRDPGTVSRALRRLDAAGLIAWERRKGARSRVTLAWVIHSVGSLRPHTDVSTSVCIPPQNGPEVCASYVPTDEVLRTDENTHARDCPGCGRPAGQQCPLAEASGCQRLDGLAQVIDLSTAFARAHP
jgi:hypothetical protein